MKRCIIWILLILSIGAFQSANGQALDTAQWFDFWVGKWEGTWTEGEGKIGKGTNEIIRTVDGKVIQESFQIQAGSSKGFKGTSISVFNPKQRSWHQAWADNQGGYYNLVGSKEGNKRIFATLPKDGVIQRMVFHSIQETSMIWDWEVSSDHGKTWKLLWRIDYKRLED